MTNREAEVFWALQHRPTNAELAEALFVSVRTVESHISALLRKLDAADRFELANLALSHSRFVASALPAALASLVDPDSLVGRDDELKLLESAWAEAAGGVRLRFVLGEAGIGKSQLVAEFADGVARRGCRVLFGACAESGGQPFQPIMEIVQACLADDPGRLGGLDIPDDALRSSGRSATGVFDLSSEGADVALALAGALVQICREPTLIVIEDLHWSSAAARYVLSELIRRPTFSPLLVVVTCRNTQPDLHPLVATFLGTIVRTGLADSLRLEGLPLDAVALLVGEQRGRHAVVEIAHETGGNPLLISERLSIGEHVGSLQALLTHRYELMAPDDIEILDIAATIGPDIHVSLLASVTAIDATTVVAALDRAVDAGIVRQARGVAAEYVFAHSLLRSVRYEQLPLGVRLVNHQLIAEAFARRGDEDDHARHACAAAPLGNAADAARAALRAGDRISAMFDPEAAGVRYRWGLGALHHADRPDPELHIALSVRYGQTLCLTHDSRGRDVLAEAAAEARDGGDLDAMTDAICAMVPVPGGAATPGRADPQFEALAEEALRLLGGEESARSVRILAAFGVQLHLGSDPPRGRRLLDSAVDQAGRLGDDYAMGHALLCWRYRALRPHETALAFGHAKRLQAIGHRINRKVFVSAGLWQTAVLHLLSGDLEAAEAARRSIRAGGAPFARLGHHSLEILCQTLRGQLTEARHELTELEQAAHEYGPTGVERVFAPTDLGVRFWEGTLADIEPLISILRADLTAFAPVVDSVSAVVFGLVGRHRQSAAILEHYLDDGADVAWHDDYTFLAAAGHFGRAAILGGHTKHALSLLTLLAPWAGNLAASGSVIITSVDALRADLLLLDGDTHEAAALAIDAIDAARRQGRVLHEAYALVVLADAWRSSGEPASSIRPLVGRASAIGADTGAAHITVEIARRGLTAASSSK